jgi:hypothetical protein
MSRYIRVGSMDKAREQIFDAVRFLAPDEAHEVLKDCAAALKKLAEEYDRKLADAIC